MTKLTKSESGKIGAAAWQKVAEQNKLLKIEEYNKNPKLCKQCNSELLYKSKNNIFCNRSCSTKFNNKAENISWHCKNCNSLHVSKPYKLKEFCNSSCQQEFSYKRRIQDWKSGIPLETIDTPEWIKRYILEKQNNKCANCFILEWDNKPIVLELEHKDGNSENNLEDNLCCLCPNCHSQTSTYKSKNIGKGRHSRRERYKEGKSF